MRARWSASCSHVEQPPDAGADARGIAAAARAMVDQPRQRRGGRRQQRRVAHLRGQRARQRLLRAGLARQVVAQVGDHAEQLVELRVPGLQRWQMLRSPTSTTFSSSGIGCGSSWMVETRLNISAIDSMRISRAQQRALQRAPRRRAGSAA